MGYRFLVILLLLCSAGSVPAQHFYFKPQLRYHVPLTSQEAPEFFDAAIVVPTGTGFYYTHIITQKKEFSLARGFSYGGIAGYMFNDKIGLELGLHYFQVKREFKSDDIVPHFPIGSTSWQFRTFNATPSLVLMHTAGILTFSAKAGVLVGLTSLGRSIFFEDKRKTYKFNNSFSAGYSFGMEIGIRINKSSSLFAEAGIENQFYKPRKALIQYDDFTFYKIEELPVYLKEIIYVKKIDHEQVYYDNEHDTYFTNYYKPLMRLKETLKLNSFYTGIGLKYNFGVHEKN